MAAAVVGAGGGMQRRHSLGVVEAGLVAAGGGLKVGPAKCAIDHLG